VTIRRSVRCRSTRTWSASSGHWPRSASAGPADYAADLRSAGFTEVATTDLTNDQAPYAVIAQLYDSGSLGGIRLVARMPAAKDKI
jgi:hypothetical protein